MKTVKRAQDYRFDVPVFGERTLDVMHESGIRTAALESGRVLILDKPAIIRKARSLRIALFGYQGAD